MDRLIDRQIENIEKVYESIPFGGKVEFSKSALESIHQVLRELKEYKDLIEQGKMIELPCKVGDKLWCINDYSKIEEVECLGFIVTSQINIIYQEKFAEDKYNMPLNSVIFLTREQAEEKLKEVER